MLRKMGTCVFLGFSLLFWVAWLAPETRDLINAPPRLLTAQNAGARLFMGMNHLFTIPDYWDDGNFSRPCCELPGKLLRAKAQDSDCREAFVESGNDKFYPGFGSYSLTTGRLYAAWRVKVPGSPVEGGRYSYVHANPGPWELWLEPSGSGGWVWHVELLQSRKRVSERGDLPVPQDGWTDARLTLSPEALDFEVNHTTVGHFKHDPYREKFRMRFGSAQPDASQPPVVSEYRYVYFNRFPYPYSLKDAMPEGPEDIRPSDRMVRNLACEATPPAPRHSEGDTIPLKDGSLLLVWSEYFKGKGWDGSPARLSAKISKDRGRTWGPSSTVVDFDPRNPGGNVMSVSLVRAKSGDILMAYFARLNGMKEKGMVLRRSRDEGRSWSEPQRITPDNGDTHVANNGAFRSLRSGRLVLPCREYIQRIRWPYALYSDDDGTTWTAGKHVPPPEITPEQVKGQNVNEPSVAELPNGRLIMMMRSVAGGNFFSYSPDRGETWTKPYLSPLRGVVAPPYLTTIPRSGDLLAIWSYGMTERTPLTSAISKDGGKTWGPVKLLEQSEDYGYGYTSVNFIGDRVYITTNRYPLFASLERFQVEPGYEDLLFLSLPIEWFYRMPH